MKLYYLFYFHTDGFSSIQTKALNKIESLNNVGIETQGVFCKKEIDEEVNVNKYLSLIPIKKLNGLMLKTKYKKEVLKEFDKYLQKNLGENDLIYMRYPNTDYFLYRFTKKYKNRIIFEFNTNHLSELKHHAKKIYFGIRPSKLITWFQEKFYPIQSEKFFAKPTLKNALFSVAMSSEISDSAQKMVGLNSTPCNALSNGINTSKIQPSKLKKIDSTINIVFMQGARSTATYYGKDRLLKGFLNYSKKEDFKIVMLGEGYEREKEFVKEHHLESYFDFKGLLSGKDLDDTFDDIHIGMGSLAIHRADVHIGSVLKVAEYAARSIPIVLGYKDMNISFNDKLKPFVLHFPADESPLDFEIIKDFAIRNYNDIEGLSILRNEAVNTMDFEVKMLELKKLIVKHNR